VGELLPSLDPLFTVHRQVQFWFDVADDDAYAAWRESPIFIWELGRGDADFIYGFPAIDGRAGGVKVASEDYATTTTPDACAREVETAEVRAMYERYIDGRLRGVTDRCLRAATCLYTVTKDVGFVVDVLPGDEDVIVASPCSGHGFKHSAAIGEAIAQMVGGGRPDLDLADFALARLG
jgi:sarcosine oxidase